MDDNKLKESEDYSSGLIKIRKRRRYLWLIILVYLPAMKLALDSPDYKTWATVVFASWIILLVIAVAFACIIRCPRCGECFHTHGPTFLPFRRCLHCALHINADKRATEKNSPKAQKNKNKS